MHVRFSCRWNLILLSAHQEIGSIEAAGKIERKEGIALMPEDASDFRHSSGTLSVADFLTDTLAHLTIQFNQGRYQ